MEKIEWCEKMHAGLWSRVKTVESRLWWFMVFVVLTLGSSVANLVVAVIKG